MLNINPNSFGFGMSNSKPDRLCGRGGPAYSCSGSISNNGVKCRYVPISEILFSKPPADIG